MIRIITKKRLELLEICEQIVKDRVEAEAVEEGLMYNCGAKGCQFQTDSPHGLSIHRGRAHK